MRTRRLALVAVIFSAISGLPAAGQAPAPYMAVEIDKFVAAPGVAFPTDYQSALVEDIAHEVSLAFETVIITRQGDAAPYGHAVLRISGTVTDFKPGNRRKRQVIGLGAGATVVEAQVKFSDAATGRVLQNRQVKGVTWTGIAGGDSKSAGESLARKIAKYCNSARLIESN
jgi:hypothetical protein